MVALLAREIELLEQRLLKRPRLDLDRTEQEAIGFNDRRALDELVGVVRDKGVARPVALEDRLHLLQSVRVAGSRDPNVPLEPGDLGGVREVRRADVGGRVAALTSEDPGLRVQPGLRGVVGDPDLGAGLAQNIERPLLGAVRVRRRQDTKRLAGRTVRRDRVGKRANAAPADERHDKIDPVGRRDLGSQLVSDRRLARGVRENSRIEQRRERRVDPLRGAVRVPRIDRAKHTRRPQRNVEKHTLVGSGFDERRSDRVGNVDGLPRPLLIVGRADRAPDQKCEVPREAIGSRPSVELVDQRLDASEVEPLQRQLEALRKKRLMKPDP